MTEEQIKALISKSIQDAMKDAMKPETIAEAVKSATDAVMKDLTTKVTEIATAHVELKDTVAKQGEAKPKDDDSKDYGDDPIALLTMSVDDLRKQVESTTTERQSEKDQAATIKLVADTLKSKKPNLKGRDGFISRIVAKAPKDEAGVLAALDTEMEFAKSIGVDTDALSVDPEKEGGKKGDANNDEQKRIEEIKNLPRTTL